MDAGERGGGNPHAAETQDARQRELGARGHLQVQKDKARQQTDGEVGHGGDGAVQVDDRQQGIYGQTVAFTRQARPVVTDRATFEDTEEEEQQTHGHGQGPGHVENDGVSANDGDAEEGDDDGDFGDDAGQDIENLGEPPALQEGWDVNSVRGRTQRGAN